MTNEPFKKTYEFKAILSANYAGSQLFNMPIEDLEQIIGYYNWNEDEFSDLSKELMAIDADRLIKKMLPPSDKDVATQVYEFRITVEAVPIARMPAITPEAADRLKRLLDEMQRIAIEAGQRRY